MPDDNQPPIDSQTPDEVKINLVVPDDIRTSFTNHFVVRIAATGEVHLLFFEVDLPYSNELDATKITTVNAKCVSKLVITKEFLGSVANVLATTFLNISQVAKSQVVESELPLESTQEVKKHAR